MELQQLIEAHYQQAKVLQDFSSQRLIDGGRHQTQEWVVWVSKHLEFGVGVPAMVEPLQYPQVLPIGCLFLRESKFQPQGALHHMKTSLLHLQLYSSHETPLLKYSQPYFLLNLQSQCFKSSRVIGQQLLPPALQNLGGEWHRAGHLSYQWVGGSCHHPLGNQLGSQCHLQFCPVILNFGDGVGETLVVGRQPGPSVLGYEPTLVLAGLVTGRFCRDR